MVLLTSPFRRLLVLVLWVNATFVKMGAFGFGFGFCFCNNLLVIIRNPKVNLRVLGLRLLIALKVN